MIGNFLRSLIGRVFSPVFNGVGKIRRFFFQIRFLFFSLFGGFLAAGFLAATLSLFSLSLESTNIAAQDYWRVQWILYTILALAALITLRREFTAFQVANIREQLHSSGSPCAALTISALLACMIFVAPSLMCFLVFYDLASLLVPMILFEGIAVLTFFSLFAFFYSRRCSTLHLIIGILVLYGFWFVWGQSNIAYLLTIPLIPFRMPNPFMEPQFFEPPTLVINRLFMLAASYVLLRLTVGSSAWGRGHSTVELPEGSVPA